MEKCYTALALAGRIFLAHIFLFSAAGKLAEPAGTQQYMASFGMPATRFFLVAAIAFELVGGLSVLLGYWSRIGAIGETSSFLLIIVGFLLLRYVVFKKDAAVEMITTVPLMVLVLPPTADIVGHAP